MTVPTTYVPPAVDARVDLDLSRNEGHTDAAALLAGIADPDRLVSRYPDTGGLRARLARLHDVTEDRVLVTAGGGDALLRCFLALGPGARVVATHPTFELVPHYAEQSRVDLVEVPWWSGPFPTAQVVAAGADGAVLVSPNNPTGSAMAAGDLERVADAVPFVVLDAAYGEFADDDLSPTALGLDNTVVIRTLSKAYGLAGLRVGCLLGPPDLVARVGAYGPPYPVGGLAASLATARLDLPPRITAALVAAVRREREELTALLARLGAEPLASQANFVLARCADAGRVVEAARAEGVALRRFAHRPGMEDMLRISLPGDAVGFARLADVLERTMPARVRP